MLLFTINRIFFSIALLNVALITSILSSNEIRVMVIYFIILVIFIILCVIVLLLKALIFGLVLFSITFVLFLSLLIYNIRKSDDLTNDEFNIYLNVLNLLLISYFFVLLIELTKDQALVFLLSNVILILIDLIISVKYSIDVNTLSYYIKVLFQNIIYGCLGLGIFQYFIK